MSSPTETASERRRSRLRPTYKDAVNDALDIALASDPRVIVMGEDIAGGAGLGAPFEGAMGGTFGATSGLLQKYGAKRVRDTPISEAGVVGAAVGAALGGLRPVVDLMWASFAPYCFDQIVNQAAKIRYMFGGQVSVPLVLRMAVGAGMRAGGQHSDTFYSVFASIPGLKVVVPATATDVKGLLLAAIDDDDPVLVLEHMSLYRRQEDFPAGHYTLPLATASIVRPGSDVTVATVGSSLHIAMPVADRLATEGVQVEVIDLRSIAPLDVTTVLTSVERTGRLVVVEESPPNCSVSGQLSAEVSERLFGRLRAPVARVTAARSPVPFSPSLEDAYLPSESKLEQQVRQTLTS